MLSGITISSNLHKPILHSVWCLSDTLRGCTMFVPMRARADGRMGQYPLVRPRFNRRWPLTDVDRCKLCIINVRSWYMRNDNQYVVKGLGEGTKSNGRIASEISGAKRDHVISQRAKTCCQALCLIVIPLPFRRPWSGYLFLDENADWLSSLLLALRLSSATQCRKPMWLTTPPDPFDPVQRPFTFTS